MYNMQLKDKKSTLTKIKYSDSRRERKSKIEIVINY